MIRLLFILLVVTSAWADGYVCRTNGIIVIGAGGAIGTIANGYIINSNGTTVFYNGRGGGANYLTVTNGTTTLGAATQNLLLSNLVAYWKLDEASGNRADSVNSHTMTQHGTVTTTNGILSLGIYEANGSTWLDTPDGADFSGGTSFSVECWAKWPSVANNNPILAKWNAAEWVLTPLNNELEWIVKKLDNSANVVVGLGANPTLGVWHHVCAGFDSTNQVIWMQYDGGARSTTAYTTACKDTSDTVAIGKYSDGATGAFSGGIDETGYWKRVLTSQEVIDLYNSGSALAYPFQ